MGPTRPDTLDGWTVRIDGLVARPTTISVEDLSASESIAQLRSDVECPHEDIGTKGAQFAGVPLSALLAEAGVEPDARFLCVQSGAFTVAFPVESVFARNGMLAVLKDGERIGWDEGGPVRLVVETGACFDTVKWVERLSLERDDSSATAESIIRARRPAE